MSGLVDLHAHVLPGIDDGPSDIESALEMVRAAAQSGITTIAATPHLRSDFPDVRIGELAGRCQELQGAMARERIDGLLVSGAEASLVWALEASDEELAFASYGQRGTDLLIETPSANVVGLDGLLYRLRAKGFRITLAHPERSGEFQRDPARLAGLAQQGVLLQVNADALLSEPRNSPVARLGQRLCADGLAHALASDAHRASSWRPVTRLAQAESAAATLVGPERARWLTQSAPAAIIQGAELPQAPPIVTQRRRRRLFG
jgi:protein-tyrosine phosphatase